MQPILEGLVKNHGYARTESADGRQGSLVASSLGIHELQPPGSLHDAWRVNRIFEQPASDVCRIDMDGDGIDEYGVIEPFHGSSVSLYKFEHGGCLPVYHCSRCMVFVPALWSGLLRGKPSRLFGCRRHALELFLIQFNPSLGRYEELTIDIGTGPSNVTVLPGDGFDTIVASSRHIGEATIYRVFD